MNGALFDGTNDYLSRGADLTGIADGQAGTVSLWINPVALGANQQVILMSGSTSAGLELSLVSDGSANMQVRLLGVNSSLSIILNLQSECGAVVGGNWNHVLLSWGLSVPATHMYVNGADAEKSGTTETNDTLDYTRGAWYVGSNSANLYGGMMAHLWFDTTYIDVTAAANLAKFVNTTYGTPADLGADGSGPTGSQPLVYLGSPYNDFGANLGSGGDFAVNGALAPPSSVIRIAGYGDASPSVAGAADAVPVSGSVGGPFAHPWMR